MMTSTLGLWMGGGAWGVRKEWRAESEGDHVVLNWAGLGPGLVGVISNSVQNPSEKRRGLCGGSWSWLGLGSEGMRN